MAPVARKSVLLFLLAGLVAALPGCQGTGTAWKPGTLVEEGRRDTRWETAETLYRQGRYEKALALLKDLLLDNPKHVKANFRAGVIHHRMGRFQEAAAYYRRTLALAPNHLKAHYNLGMIYAEHLVDLGGARKHLRKFLELQPPPELEAEARKVLERVERRLGQMETPRPLPGTGPVPKPLPDTRPTRRRAERPASRTTPRLEGLTRELQALAWSKQGDAAARPQEKIAAYRKALELDPSLVDVRVKLGRAYLAQGMTRQAEAAFREAIRQRPHDPRAHRALLDLLEGSERWKEAIQACRHLTRVRPDLAWAWERLGILYQRMENGDKALQAYRKSLQLDASRASAHYRLGVLYETLLEDDAKAVQHYRKYLKLAPQEPRARTVRERLQELED